MSLLQLFVSSIRRATAEAVRQGISDGIRSVLNGQAIDGGATADEAEAEVRLLLLPAPEPEVPAQPKRRKAE